MYTGLLYIQGNFHPIIVYRAIFTANPFILHLLPAIWSIPFCEHFAVATNLLHAIDVNPDLNC